MNRLLDLLPAPAEVVVGDDLPGLGLELGLSVDEFATAPEPGWSWSGAGEAIGAF